MTVKRRVAVSAASFAKSQPLLDELARLGVDVSANRTGRVLTPAELGDFLAESKAEAAIVGTEAIDGPLLDRCPSLRFVAKYGVGLDNVDEPALAARGVGLGWTGGVNRRGVAELVLGYLIGHFRNLVPSVLRLKQGQWVKDGGREVGELTIGIVGFGHVGTELAGLLRSFGARVLYCDIVDRRDAAAALGATSTTYDAILETADVVTFHVPATAETRGMFGEREIARAKPTTLVVNTSRGSVVDFEATCRAVTEGRLGGFAADVFPVEPCDLTAWAGAERLYFTPHIAGNSKAAVRAMGASAIEHVKAYLAGTSGS